MNNDNIIAALKELQALNFDSYAQEKQEKAYRNSVPPLSSSRLHKPKARRASDDDTSSQESQSKMIKAHLSDFVFRDKWTDSSQEIESSSEVLSPKTEEKSIDLVLYSPEEHKLLPDDKVDDKDDKDEELNISPPPPPSPRDDDSDISDEPVVDIEDDDLESINSVSTEGDAFTEEDRLRIENTQRNSQLGLLEDIPRPMTASSSDKAVKFADEDEVREFLIESPEPIQYHFNIPESSNSETYDYINYTYRSPTSPMHIEPVPFRLTDDSAVSHQPPPSPASPETEEKKFLLAKLEHLLSRDEFRQAVKSLTDESDISQLASLLHQASADNASTSSTSSQASPGAQAIVIPSSEPASHKQVSPLLPSLLVGIAQREGATLAKSINNAATPSPARKPLSQKSLPKIPPKSTPKKSVTSPAPTPPTPKIIPRLATDVPKLPLHYVSQLQSMDFNKQFPVLSLNHIKKLRLTIKSSDISGDDWEMSNRGDFLGLYAARNEFMMRGAESSLKKQNTNRLTRSIRRVIDPLMAHSQLFDNNIKQLRKNSPHIAQLQHFLRCNYLGYVVLVFNKNMQLLGSYDYRLSQAVPGIEVCFQSERKFKRLDFRDKTSANLFSVDLESLPPDAFAIVPVLYDSSPPPAQFPKLDILCNLSLYGYLDADTLVVDEDEEESSSLDSEESEIITEQASKSDEWFNYGNFAASRITRETDVGDANKAIMRNQMSYAPFVLFKQETWKIKHLNETMDGVNPRDISLGVLDALKRKYVVPWHVVHVEHCINCEDHSMTTWHIPGSYHQTFIELKKTMRQLLPASLIFHNMKTITPKPRCGSFEIVVHPYQSALAQCVFSKLSAKAAPNLNKIIQSLSNLILYEKVKFSGFHSVEIHVYDNYSRKKIHRANVTLYKVNVNLTIDQNIESILDAPGPVEENPKKEDGNAAATTPVTLFQPDKKEKKSTPAKKGLPSAKHDSRRKNEKSDSPSDILRSTDVKDAEFRHSNAYYRVRNWGKDDVTAWFRSYEVSDAVISNALNEGVSDGVALITTGNAQTLQQWGVRNRIILQQMLQSLEFLRTRDNDKYITDDHIIESAAVMPEASSSSVRLELMTKKETNHDGIAVMAVNTSGLYMYHIESPLCAPYYSHAFYISSAGSSASCVSINPKFGKVHFIITLDSDNSDITDSDLYSDGGVLVSVVNFYSVRRHLVFVKSNTECTKDEAMAILTGSKKKQEDEPKEPLPSDGAQQTATDDIESPPDITTSASADAAAPVVLNRRDTRYTERPAPLKRATTVGGMLFGELKARSSRQTLIRTNSKNVTVAVNKMKATSELKEQNYRVLYTTVWLPVGKYYSEVDGSVFEVKQDSHQKIELSFSTAPSADTCAFQKEAEALILTCHEEQSIKCHRRLVLKSVKAFQKIYRRYKKSFLMDYMFAYMVLRRGFRKVIARIRHTIRCRHATTVQSWIRMTRARHAFADTRRKVLKAQTIARVWTARRKLKKLAEIRKRIQKNMVKWFINHKKYKRNCIVMIQCFFRVCKAKRVLKYLRLQKRIDRVILKWIRKVKYQLEVKKYWEYIAYLEACERYYMEVEELQMINFIYAEKAHKRQIAEELARRFEIKRNCMCVIIQKYARRFVVKSKLARADKHIRHIQKRFRIWRYDRKLQEKIPVKYVPGFPQLIRHPCLLGGTKILLGMRLRPKTLLEEPHMAFTTDLVMHVLLHPTIKVQSTWKMHRERSKYVSRHLDLYGELPPLFRNLIPKPPTPPDSEDDEMSRSSGREWDNGAQEILDHLGYSKKRQKSEHSEDEGGHDMPDAAHSDAVAAAIHSDDHDDASSQYNLYNVRSSIRNMFIHPSKRLIMQYDAKYNRCATVIQSAARRYIAKKMVQALRIERLNAVVCSPPASPEPLDSIKELAEVKLSADNHDAMSEMSETIRTKQSKFDITRMTSNVSESFNSTAKPLVRELSRALSGSYQAVTEQLASTTEAVKQKYNESKELKKLQSIQEANEKERYDRIKRGDVCIEDAIMGIRGTVCDGLPRLERQWYIGVFPITFEEAEKGYQVNHQEYEMSQGRFVFEAVRSTSLTPLSREGFNMFRFHVHLADITKYKHIDVALFIEVTENPANQAVRPDALPRDVSIPCIKQLPPMRSSDVKYLPAFHGTCSVNGGLSFTPCGGRRHVPMTPNLSSAMYLTKAQARRLQTISSLDLVFTLNPVAVQAGTFLQSLYNMKKPYPVYPCGVLDGFLLEKQDIEVKDFYGAVVCMVHFHGRNLVSSRHRGLPYGIVEYDDDGNYLGKVFEHSENLGTISIMIGCHIHVLLCGTSGGVIPLLQRTDGTFEATRLVPLHEYPIIGGACIYRADLEFFFTIDRKGYIGIVLLENGLCLKSFINNPLSQDAATTIVASSDKLYIGLSSGYVYTVDVTEILNGNLKEAENLVKYVVSYDMVFKDGAEVASIAIMHPSGYFGSVNEDNKASQLISIPANITTSAIIKKRLQKIHEAEKPVEQTYDCVLEGHVIVFGGGDKDPRVRMMRPLSNRTTSYGGFQEIYSFTDHTRAVTQIALDAAGRFIIAGSQATKKMFVWNAQSFHVEAQHDYVNVGFFGIGNNCLFACSFKAPFISIWKVINWEKIREERKYVKYAPTGAEDGRPHIAMIRKALWCRIITHGGQKPPEVSLMRASHFLGIRGAELVQRWKVYYDQNIKYENKRTSPEVKDLRRSPSNVDVMGVMLRKLNSQSVWDPKDGDSDDGSSFMDRISVVESEDVASKAETVESAVKMVDAAISVQSGEISQIYGTQETYDAEWYERNGYVADDGYWYPFEQHSPREEKVRYQKKKKRFLPHFSDDSEDETEPITLARSSSEEMSEEDDDELKSIEDERNAEDKSVDNVGEVVEASISNNEEEEEPERYVFSKERKEAQRVQRYQERQRMIRRGLLHNLADDLSSSSDSD